MNELLAFLEARIAEDEKGNQPDTDPESWCDRIAGTHYDHGRITSECAAKRALADLHAPTNYGMKLVCNECGDWWDGSPVDYPCPTIKILAAVYKDHPDYQQEWAL